MRTLTLLPITILLNQLGQPTVATGIIFGVITLVCVVLDIQDVVKWIQ